jgi:hypothetical protein
VAEGPAASSGPPGSRRDQAPARPRLDLRATLAAAARAGRRHAAPILAVAIAVSLVTAIGDVLVEHLIDPGNASAWTLAEFGTTAVSLLGTVLLSGLVCRLTGAVEAGRRRPGLGQVARSLPWVRLVLADLAVVAIVLVGVLLLVIPGLIALALLAITGPVIEIEDRPVRGALRRSAQLIRSQFWRCFLIAGLPLILINELEALLPEPHGVGEIAEVLAIKGIVEGVLEAAIALVLVSLTFRLIAMDKTARQSAAAEGTR